MRTDGFAVFVCTCDPRAVRDDLIVGLAASMTKDIHRQDVDDNRDQDPLDAILASVPDNTGSVMMTGIDRLLDRPEASERFFRHLNLRREDWPATLQIPVVFWVSRRMLGRLSGGAPDFFDWRSDTIDFPEGLTSTAVFGERQWRYGANPRFSWLEQDERCRELEARIRAAGTTDDAHVLTSLVTWWDELADLRFFQGEPDEALRIRREEQLPVYERLGDVRSRAITMQQIASGLLAKGGSTRENTVSAHAALAESFALLTRLGDPHGIAYVGLQLAQTLVILGRHKAALGILTDVRSAFDRLDSAQGRSQVADLELQMATAAGR